jgi:hypothetical protein
VWFIWITLWFARHYKPSRHDAWRLDVSVIQPFYYSNRPQYIELTLSIHYSWCPMLAYRAQKCDAYFFHKLQVHQLVLTQFFFSVSILFLHADHITRAFRKVTSGGLLRKQAMRKKIIILENTYVRVFKLLLRVVTTGIEALWCLGIKFCIPVSKRSAVLELSHIFTPFNNSSLLL